MYVWRKKIIANCIVTFGREIDKVVAINYLIFPVTDNFSLYCANRQE